MVGKSISGESYKIQQPSVYIAQMVTVWLRLSCQGHSEKDPRRPPNAMIGFHGACEVGKGSTNIKLWAMPLVYPVLLGYMPL